MVGAGVVGCATALELARRGLDVLVLEAEPEPGLQASGTNSGILHTGFDSTPGELETEMILRAGELRDELLEALSIPVIRCGAQIAPADDRERAAVVGLARNAERNGVAVEPSANGGLVVPGESVTDPVAFTVALADAAVRHGARIETGSRVERLDPEPDSVMIGAAGADEPVGCRAVVNCAGLGAAGVARAAGDRSFEVFPRKGEFVVFEPPAEQRLERILLPVPSPGTKGVLVFPTIDGKLIAGPTAIDGDDPEDWAVRAGAIEEIAVKARRLYPPLEGLGPIASYAGLRPAGRGVNYVIGPSPASPRLINVAAIRSTGLTASPAIAERVGQLLADLGLELGARAPLERAQPPRSEGPWWRRTADHRGLAAGPSIGEDRDL